MATLEHLAEGIRRAHAAGNAEHVKVLGQEYRRQQAQQAGGALPEAMANASVASQRLQGGPGPKPQLQNDLATSTAATISGIVNGIPVLGPLAQGASDSLMGLGSQLTGGDYGQTVKGLQDRRAQIKRAAPIASMAGELGGALGSFGGLAAAAPKAMGVGGKMLPGLFNAGLSQQGLYTADQLSRGNGGVDSLGYGVPFLAGAGSRIAGDLIQKGGQGVADIFTKGAQRRMTAAATAGGPATGSSEIKSTASQMFEQATGGQPLMLDDPAFFRFLSNVRQTANKFRINADNDRQSVGLLETLMRIADDTANGVKVDMKDLHLVRQLAQKVSQSAEGRDQAFASSVIRQMDEFINTLKPADILGGADPSQAANALLNGISTWSRANKVAVIEEAIRTGSVAASGAENGIRNAFRSIVKKPDIFNRFNKAEQQAIMDVVEGTGGANLLKLIGKFGFGTGNASNMLGGTIGFGAGSMSPLGPLGGILAAGGATAARKGSEVLTNRAAQRALAAAGTPNLPIAKPAPNLLRNVPVQQLLRAGAFSAGN